jgi:predicted secreted protein
MHINDIKAFTNKVSMDEEFHGKRVVIKATQDMGGLYITRSGKFDGTKDQAVRYDYDLDKVGEQVMFLNMNNMPVEVEGVE